MKKILFYLAFSFIAFLQAQKSDELMKINGKTISVEEFKRLYLKNLDLVQDPEQKNIENYKNLFIDYKLELEDAYAQKYDTNPRFKRELKQYRNELAKKYLSDADLMEKLTKEAYERMKTDVHVAHILIQVPVNASPADTLKAYNKIMKVYQLAKKGENFSELAKKYSEDPSAKENGGDLDYINVFHTVYPFETAAYKTAVGQISKPFRTRFGYHIVKVIDKRPARGEIEVAHILTIDNPKIKRVKTQDAKTRIDEIYKKLIDKKDTFENLARKFSDDKNSARYGGKLRKFGIRQMIPAFENQAFALKNPGDFSKPFKSRFGWHIVKLIKKYPVPPYKEIKDNLKRKVARDERSKLSKEKLYKRIQKQFPVKQITPLKKIYPLINEKFFNNQWKIPGKEWKKQTLFTINNDKNISVYEFFEFIYKRQQKNPKNYVNKKQVINSLFERFKKEKLMQYYDEHLEDIYPEFAAIVKEYKEGLLLFNIKSDKVWNKAVKDTLGLEKFFETHKQNYIQPKKYKVMLAQVNDKKTAKKLEKDFKKNSDLEKIKEKYKDKGLIIKEKIYTSNDKFVQKHQLETKKIVRYKDGNQYVVIKLVEVIQSHIPEMNKIKGKLINDYQDYLEKEWLKELKTKYPVEINQKNWKKLRAKYQNKN